MTDLAAEQSQGADLAGRDRWLQKSAPDPAERVPLLAERLAVMAELLTDSFCSFSASEGEYQFRGLRATTVADVRGTGEALPIYAALKINAWEAVLGLRIDRVVVSTVIESFFGGGDDGEVAADDRPISPIEVRIVDVIGGQIAMALSGALNEILPTRVDFDRTMAKPDSTFLGKPPTPLLAATFSLKTVGRTVDLELLLPLAPIEARIAAFSAADGEAPPLDDAGWTRQLKSEVTQTTLRIEAGMAMRPMSLGAISSLRVGQVIELPSGAGASVLVRSGDEDLFRSQLGQSAGFYTVRIDEPIQRAPQPPRKGR